MRGKVLIQRPNYTKAVPARIRRSQSFKRAIEIRKKLVSLVGHFDNVGYNEKNDVDCVYWEWEASGYVFSFLVTIDFYNDHETRYWLKIESSVCAYILLCFNGLLHVGDSDLKSFADHWNDGVKEGHYGSSEHDESDED